MKLVILTAIIAAVVAGPVLESKQEWPWKVGKEYRYEVNSYTWTKFENSETNGNAFKGQFVVRVVAPGQLVGKVEHPKYAQVNDVEGNITPESNYKALENIDLPFEIFVEEGRVVSMNVPSSISVAYENLLKALVSALQVDLSSYGYVANYPNNLDTEAYQGLFKKMEADVTGDCETLYAVSPTPAEWRRELPLFAAEEDPITIVKVKNYEACHQRAAFNYGVPEGSLWQGIATENDEKQLIKHTSEARILVGKQGTIYKSETSSLVSVSPLLFGKQKAEVKTSIKFNLLSVDSSNEQVWKKPTETRTLTSLLYTLSESTFLIKSETLVTDAQKLLQDITPLFKNPGNLPKTDFLSKFNVLVNILASMKLNQLNELTSSIEVAKLSKNVAKHNMWVIYRDAVAQAGTDDAFKEIKSWILAKKIQGEEAGEVLFALAASLWETTDIAPEFFELAFTPEVYEQDVLNTTALLAASRTLRYTTNKAFITNEVIPRLSKELKLAIESGNNNKANVFIRVLGNVLNSEILNVYAPYIEGKIPTSQYLRRQMVVSLKNLANAKDEHVRAALFSIIINTAEPYEIRGAAALNIFLAVPTTEMFQVFAQMTKYDPSNQVRAVLANTITFASNLKDPRFAELARKAKSVLDSISKEKFGYRYSTDSIIDVYTDDEDITFFRELSFIGSEDNILPKYQRTALRSRSTAWSEESEVTMSMSNIQQFFEIIKQMLYEPTESNAEFKFSAKKIAELLNIKPVARDPFEGELFIENLNQQKLFNFNEAELQEFLLDVAKNFKQLLIGNHYYYSKVLNKRQVTVVFPLITGMPFVYEYNEPLVIIAQGQFKVKLDATDKSVSGTLENEFEITYGRNLDGSVGFVDTLGDKFISTGVVNKFQVNAPLKVDINLVKPTDFKLKIGLLHPEEDADLVHFSVSPYTSKQDKDSFLAVLEDPVTKPIERPNKVISVDKKVGYWTGMFYQLQGFSYSSDWKQPENLFEGDFLTSVGYLLYQKDVASTLYNFKYLGETPNKVLTLNFFSESLFDQNKNGEWGPATSIDETTANNFSARWQEVAKRAALGIKSAEVKVYDISASFDGRKPVEWFFTAALAENHFDSKLQGAFFARAEQQVNMVFKVEKPKLFPLNFEEALKNDLKVTYEADFKFGNASNINLKGYGERSEEYKAQLLNDPLAKACLLQSSKKNFYQKECHKIIIKSHAPDFFKASITFKEQYNTNYLAVHTYDLFKNWFSQFEEEFSLDKLSPSGTVDIKARAYYYDQYVNYEFVTKYGTFRLKNVEGLAYYPYAMAFYAPLNSWERARNWFTSYQHLPFCTVDDNKIRTFSGRSYDYSLTSSWHVVMLDEANNHGQWTDLVILARRPSENQEEVYISYKPGNGKDLEVEIKPSSVVVKSSAHKTTEGPLTIYWDEIAEQPLFEYYEVSPGVKVFSIENGGIRLVYDNQRLVIFTDEHRTYTRGICGQSSSQAQDDYLTPWGIVDLPEYYGAAFSLEGEFSDPKTVEFKKEAKLKAYQPVTKYTNIFHSDSINLVES